ncbi:MAG: hypothetical protein ACLR2E_06485 [Lachnospiraceae bacterium]
MKRIQSAYKVFLPFYHPQIRFLVPLAFGVWQCVPAFCLPDFRSGRVERLLLTGWTLDCRGEELAFSAIVSDTLPDFSCERGAAGSF